METFEKLLSVDWQAFHFIRPTWLFAMIPLVLIAIGLKKINARKSGWQGILATHLYRHMVITKGGKTSAPPFYLLSLCWMLACIAMAGPTWQKLPQPVYQVNTGKVLIMDMSLSMRSTDITPDRLTRARFKAIDLLNSIDDGEVGLVVYAGDAFTVSPLTSDVSNIIALIPSLRPEIMPVPGSYPLSAFEQAKQLLANAGYTKGDIYWISDGIEFDDVSPITDFISQSDFQVSILGIGTDAGAPIKQMDGSLLKDTSGNIVIPRLESRYFNQVSGAARTSYVRLSVDDTDIKAMKLEHVMLEEDQVKDEILGEGDQWQDMGAFVVMLLLPFAAYAFRRGILVIACSVFMMSPADHAYAQQASSSSPPASPATSTISSTAEQDGSDQSAFNNGFFKTDNQRGQQAFEQGDFEQAAELFDDPMWQGAAHYEQGNYEAALEQYTLADGNDALYNQANAMAKLGNLQAALKTYEDVLAREPNHENAIQNKEIIERLLEQQEQQQDQQDSQNGDSEQENQDQNGENQDSEHSDPDQNGSEQDGEQQDGQQSDQQGEPQDGQNTEQQDGQQSEEQESQQQGDAQQDNQNEPNDEQQSQQTQNQGEGDDQSNEQEQQAANVEQSDEPLTPEQLEQLQRDRIMLNKVPDDPAFLLQRKMQLESQKRKRDRLPNVSKKEW